MTSWNVLFIFGFIAVCIFFALSFRKRGIDKKIEDSWKKMTEDVKDKAEEVKGKF